MLHSALKHAQSLGAEYADIRYVCRRGERIVVKNGNVDYLSSQTSEGIGIRVLVNGAWGFAGTNAVAPDEARRAADLAVRIARASSAWKKNQVVLSPLGQETGEWHGPCGIDPFSIPIQQKIDLLRQACFQVQAQGTDVRSAVAEMAYMREGKEFVSTEGRELHQEFCEAGAGVSASAVGSGEVQKRSYPGPFGGNTRQAGYEFIESLGLIDQAARVGQEALALLSAPQCPSATTTLILGSNQMALQIHESCGHPIELDRVFGAEASYAGTSFLTTDKRRSFHYGSDLVNITADSSIPGGLGTFGWDDEGVAASRTPIVQNGVFMDYLMSRETAARLGVDSNGAMRATGWDRLPIIRMTNVSLEPGDETLESLVRGTDDGILMDGIKSWSIDDRRVNFQFGCEIGWRILNGEIAGLVKNPTYTGITPDFWGSCDGVAGQADWNLWGLPNCGKGQPVQVAHVGHGTAPARFRDVKVGVGRW